MEYLVLSKDCLDDFIINENMTVISNNCEELDAIVIPLKYVEQIIAIDYEKEDDEDVDSFYSFYIKPTISIKELQKLMIYANYSSASESWFYLTFGWKYITFK